MYSAGDVRLNRARTKSTLVVFSLAASVWIGSAPARAEQPGEPEIARALETVEADPNLATVRTIKMLRWKSAGGAKRSKMPSWVAWIVGLFRWLDQSARLLVWGVVVVLAGSLVVYIARMVGGRSDPARGGEAFVAPGRVQDLDIRPESLPDDVGAAARALWDRSEHRAALALLYRGMLSRFAHVHRVPIRDSSTERDCLALAAAHLPAAPSDYALRLVREWQRAVYGCEDIETPIVHGLCEGFAPALDQAALVAPLESKGTV